MNHDPLVSMITGYLVGLDATARRKMPGAMWVPQWSAEEFDNAGRAVATMLRKAVDEVLSPYLDEVEQAILTTIDEEIDRRGRPAA
jgi:hypothetical protein